MKRKGFCLIMVLCMLAGCAQAGEELSRDSLSEDHLSWEEAASTPYGKYPSLVTYTLGKMTGENNSNMPEGDTYEDNVYTRYLREALNIQNEDVFEESEEQYAANVRMAIASRELPDVMVVENRQTLVQLARRRCTPAGCIFSLGLALAALAAQFADILTQVRERDWSALMDTIGPLVAVVVFFCAVTLALNLLAAAMGQKRK